VNFDLGSAGPATLKIYDVSGRLVRTLVDAQLPQGSHKVSWDGRSENGQAMPSGVYMLEMVAPDYRGRHKLILAR
jgi:flagellar hook assembly protein FlgD